MSGEILGIYKLDLIRRALPIGSHLTLFNLLTTSPTHLAMFSICSSANSCAVFLAQNECKKITCVNNTRHAHSHIELTEAYLSGCCQRAYFMVHLKFYLSHREASFIYQLQFTTQEQIKTIAPTAKSKYKTYSCYVYESRLPSKSKFSPLSTPCPASTTSSTPF